MQRIKFILFVVVGVLGMLIPSISQAQWQALPAMYPVGSEIVNKAGSWSYSILTGTEWGGVTCTVQPPLGGLCDCEVTISFNWKWTGDSSQITNLMVTPQGDLVGTGLLGPDLYGSQVETFGLSALATQNTVPGPYNLSPDGVQQTFMPRPPSPFITVTGQCHSIVQMPGGPYQSGASAQSYIYWTLP